MSARRTLVQQARTAARSQQPWLQPQLHAARSSSSRPSTVHALQPAGRWSSHTTRRYLCIAAGLVSIYAATCWADNHGLRFEVLAYAKADERAASTGITPHTALDETPVHLDPDTSIPFPATLSPIGALSSSLSLVGLGVRTVSFLRVKVYSAGAYFDNNALEKLKGKAQDGEGEALMSYLLDQPYDISIRIVPTRNTDHSHLRDGFVRAMLARMKAATSSKLLSDEQAELAGRDLDVFKGFFPTGKVAKGKYMMITRRGSDGALLLEYEGKLLGTLDNSFLSKQLLLAYFADGGKEISSRLKSDVLAGLERYR